MKRIIKKFCVVTLAVIMSFSMLTAFALTPVHDSPELNQNIAPEQSAVAGDSGDVRSPQTGDYFPDALVLFLPVVCMVSVFVVKSTKKNLE